jgi:hypothetical protein
MITYRPGAHSAADRRHSSVWSIFNERTVALEPFPDYGLDVKVTEVAIASAY